MIHFKLFKTSGSLVFVMRKLGMVFDHAKSMRMPRLKPDQPETFYHIMSRTAQKAFYLDETYDAEMKPQVDEIIRSMAQVYYVEIFAWVFMDNHIHLALSVKKPEMDPKDVQARFLRLQDCLKHPKSWREQYLERCYERFTDLSWFMWEINRRIAVVHNQRHQTGGHFWGGRFKSKIIEDEKALLKVMTYIEQNPVRAKLCQKPSEYRWCSAGATRKDIKKGLAPKVPAINVFRNMTAQERAKAYVLWMDHQADLILHPELRSERPPPDIQRICLNGVELEGWRADFQDGTPSDWSTQGFGTSVFMDTIAKGVVERQQALARKR